MLMEIWEVAPSKPRERPNLAAKGYHKYAYTAEKLKEKKKTHKQGIIDQAQEDMHHGNDFVSLAQQLGNQVAIKGKTSPKPFASTREYQGVV